MVDPPTWEGAGPCAQGADRVETPPGEWVLDALRRSAMTATPLTHGIALRSESLDGFAAEDPADRFLVATALEHDLTLVTADRAMQGFEPLRTLW